MRRRIQDGYIYLTAVILFVTATVEFSSAVGSTPILDWLDPLLLVSNRHVFMLGSLMDAGVSAFLFLGKERGAKVMLIGWLASIYVIYRAGLWWAGVPILSCYMGNLTDSFPISVETLNHMAWGLLAWLLVGSHAVSLFDWISHRTLKLGQTQ